MQSTGLQRQSGQVGGRRSAQYSLGPGVEDVAGVAITSPNNDTRNGEEDSPFDAPRLKEIWFIEPGEF